jgi:serine/threonine protein phosphatase PrpC
MAINYFVEGDSFQGRRNENQDSLTFVRKHNIYAIADGVSDRPKAKEGSSGAVKVVRNRLEENIIKHKGKPADWAKAAMERANEIVFTMNCVRDNSGEVQVAKLANTTLDFGFIYNHVLYGAHIGDSRVYLLSNEGNLEQITTDHSTDGYLQKMLGKIKKIEDKKDYDSYAIPLAGYKRILFATDGVYKLLSNDELKKSLEAKDAPAALGAIFALAAKPMDIAKKYVEEHKVPFDHAQSRLGRNDNMTAIVVVMEGE